MTEESALMLSDATVRRLSLVPRLRELANYKHLNNTEKKKQQDDRTVTRYLRC
ncbi:MAG: hypothetical protein ACFFD4_19720 [Candidatus Odinarchaeota archaeon]